MEKNTEIDNGATESGIVSGKAILGTERLQDNTTKLVEGLFAQENNLTIEGIYATLKNIKHPEMLPSEIINLQNKNGWTTLMLAARDGDEKIVSHLVSHPELKPNLQNTTGNDAVWLAKTDEIRAMIQAHSNYKYRNQM